MSHIAAALAKSKGKAVQPVTEDVPKDRPAAGVSRPPMSMPANAAPGAGEARKKKILLLAAAALVILGAGAWFLLSQKDPQPAPAAVRSRAPAAPAAAQPAKQVDFARNPSPAPAPGAPPTLAAGAPAGSAAALAAEPVPSDEIFATVRKFTVSAVKAGPDGRAVINGKAYHVGDEVAPGITLSEIRDGQLLFADETGSVYPRRF
ncbi:MAG: hypothetical protein HY302_09840 [Opitutae bacterium]|nr:hypothetical protein [Opitutae bacterium]